MAMAMKLLNSPWPRYRTTFGCLIVRRFSNSLEERVPDFSASLIATGFLSDVHMAVCTAPCVPAAILSPSSYSLPLSSVMMLDAPGLALISNILRSKTLMVTIFFLITSTSPERSPTLSLSSPTTFCSSLAMFCISPASFASSFGSIACWRILAISLLRSPSSSGVPTKEERFSRCEAMSAHFASNSTLLTDQLVLSSWTKPFRSVRSFDTASWAGPLERTPGSSRSSFPKTVMSHLSTWPLEIFSLPCLPSALVASWGLLNLRRRSGPQAGVHLFPAQTAYAFSKTGTRTRGVSSMSRRCRRYENMRPSLSSAVSSDVATSATIASCFALMLVH
mmetsp:Transcript_9659/g.23547  ORF Transcript_9659/g.23547 Transcript_9659/m.23547 type:complete len:335 (-) Transcript_9659:1027-2031(-)